MVWRPGQVKAVRKWGCGSCGHFRCLSLYILYADSIKGITATLPFPFTKVSYLIATKHGTTPLSIVYPQPTNPPL
jgi:hypothetical protein